ncbi:hypothetical protein BDV33DRAFT_197273 [Aspergillus novoparasiticus]|uniref:BTB domain-containing protein n=1 Tax=Aspergillus novoparasiticus TaxID=986946 RepID=A0A5N6F9E1_9EURO|nr:hypothetical protein BDV33DRAFT_197273 [Aspergillus novoparasiticus]
MSNSTGKHLMSGAVVKLDVGVPPVSFNVHIKLLCKQSPAFAGLYSGSLAYRIQDHISLPEEDPDAFAIFYDLMYPDRVRLKHPGGFLDLFKLWVLADSLEMSRLQNDVTMACKTLLKRSAIGIDAVSYAYESTLPGSPLRQMAVDSWVSKEDMKRFRAHKGTLPCGFLEDLCSVFFERGGQKSVQRFDQQHFKSCYCVPDPKPESDHSTVLVFDPFAVPATVVWKRRRRSCSTLCAPICDRSRHPDTEEDSDMESRSSVKSEGSVESNSIVKSESTADDWSTDTDEIPLPTNKKRKLVRSGH